MPAIPFITVDGRGQFRLNPDAATFLESLNNDPLVIAAVAGKYRTGKCLGPDDLVLLANGTSICAKDVSVGHVLVGDDGRPRVVVETVHGRDNMFRVRPADRRVDRDFDGGYTCNSDHLLVLEAGRGPSVVVDAINQRVRLSYRDMEWDPTRNAFWPTMRLTTFKWPRPQFSTRNAAKEEAVLRKQSLGAGVRLRSSHNMDRIDVVRKRDNVRLHSFTFPLPNVSYHATQQLAELAARREAWTLKASAPLQWTVRVCDLYDAFGEGDEETTGTRKAPRDRVYPYFCGFRVAVDAFPQQFDFQRFVNESLELNNFETKNRVSSLSAAQGAAYCVGVWLGDGDASRTHKICQDADIHPAVVEALRQLADASGVAVRTHGTFHHMTSLSGVRGLGGSEHPSNEKEGNPLQHLLARLNLGVGTNSQDRPSKFIPAQLLSASREVRLYLLAGLLDTDGFYSGDDGHCYEITQKRQHLAADVVTLARSLGFRCNMHKKQIKLSGRSEPRTHYRVFISGEHLHEIPCHIPTKRAVRKVISRRRNSRRYGVEVEKLGDGDYYGFTVAALEDDSMLDQVVSALNDLRVAKTSAALYVQEVGNVIDKFDLLVADSIGRTVRGRNPGRFLLADFTVTHNSFFLNRVLLDLHNGDGFGVGGTIQACTKGLWLHTNLLGVTRKDPVTGEQRTVNVLIVDTEGLGAFNATDTHDSRIFALALLLSSYFIYNSVGTIDESAISTLSLVANISKHVRVHSNESNSMQPDGTAEAAAGTAATNNDEQDADVVQQAKELGEHFPHFLWLVRDFSLALVDDDGDAISERQYLENALRDKQLARNTAEGSDQSTQEKNRLRALLRAYFPHRTCTTLVRPCLDENDLRRVDSMGDADLRPEFREQAHRLRRKILREAPVKTVLGTRPVSGRMLTRLAQSYIDALNAGAAPVIRDSWALLAEAQFRDALDRAERAFHDALTEANASTTPPPPPVDPTRLEQTICVGNSAANALFVEESPEANGPVFDDFRRRLTDRLTQAAEAVRSENLRQMDTLARDVLQAMESNDLPSALEQNHSWSQFAALFEERHQSEFVVRVGDGFEARTAWCRVAVPRLQAWPRHFFAAFERQLERLQRDLAEARADRERALEQSHALQQQVDEATRRVQTLTEQLAAEEERGRAAREALEREYTETLETARRDVLAMRAAKDAAEDLAAERDVQMTEREAAFANERAAMADAALASASAVSLDEVEALRADLERAVAEATALRQQAAAANEARLHAQHLEADHRRLETELRQAREEVREAADDFRNQLARIDAEETRVLDVLRAARDDEERAHAARVNELTDELNDAREQWLQSEEALQTAQKKASQEREAARVAATTAAEKHEADVTTLRDKLERKAKTWDEQRRAFKKAARDASDKYERETRELHDSWRVDVQKHAQERLALTRLAKEADGRAARFEAQLNATRQRLEDYGDVNELRRAKIDAERSTAALEHAHAEIKTLRAQEFETRQRFDEANARILTLEKEVKDQERRHEVARLKLRMDYEVQSARQRVTTATAGSSSKRQKMLGSSSNSSSSSSNSSSK